MAPATDKKATRLRERVGERVEAFFGQLAMLAYRRPWSVLGLVAVTVLISLFSARGLKVSADLAELLPESFPSVQAVDELKERWGGIGYVVVVVSGDEPAELRRFADDVVPKLSALPDVSYVDYQRPNEFFADHALYFMSLEDLETMRDRLEARRQYEVRKGMPLYDLGLDDEPQKAPSIDMSDITDKYGKGRSGAYRLQGNETYYVSKDGKLLAIFVKPDRLSADLSFARRIGNDVRRVVEDAKPAGYGGARVELTGSYVKKVEQQDIITRDLAMTSGAALVAMLLFIGIYMRRLRAVVFVFTPLLVGLAWTFALARSAFGVLNLMTSFLGAILLGLGIDHGIHLFGRFQAERGKGSSVEESVRLTFGETGRAVTVAALTTTVGFAGLSISEFRAFREFGGMAAFGTALILAAYLVVGPALLSLITRRGRALQVESAMGRAWAGNITRHSKWVLGGALVVCVGLAMQVPRIAFNYDFEDIQGSHLRSFQLDREVNTLLGRSQSPVVFLTRDVAHEAAVSEALRSTKAKLGEGSTIDFVLALADLVPDGQADKRKVLDGIEDVARSADKFDLDEKQKKQLADIKRMAQAKPFDRNSLPIEVRRQMTGEDTQGVVLAFPNVRQSDGREVMRLASELRSTELPGGEHLQPAAEAMVLADVISMVIRESPEVLAITTVAMLLTLVLLMARLRSALLSLAIGGLTVALTLAALPIVGVQLNYLNITIVPVLFGLGVDGTVHMVTRVEAGLPLDEAVSETGRAIFGSLLTTALGFGALLLSSHNGLNSIGALALVGLATNALLTLVLVPSLLALRRREVVAVA